MHDLEEVFPPQRRRHRPRLRDVWAKNAQPPERLLQIRRSEQEHVGDTFVTGICHLIDGENALPSVLLLFGDVYGR